MEKKTPSADVQQQWRAQAHVLLMTCIEKLSTSSAEANRNATLIEELRTLYQASQRRDGTFNESLFRDSIPAEGRRVASQPIGQENSKAVTEALTIFKQVIK